MEFLTDRSASQEAAARVRLLALDVDGVMTAGELLYTSSGEEIKAFNILDGLGIKLLQRENIIVAIISGRQSPMLTRRAAELGIDEVIQGREDKSAALQVLAGRLGVPLDEAAYAGDDLPDLGAIRAAGLGITVPNGHPALREHAMLCTSRAGGNGAVREIADYLLLAHGRLDAIVSDWL